MFKKLFKYSIVAFVFLPVLALAQNTVSNSNTTSCFDYYKFGSVQATVESATNNTNAGSKINFTGTIKNANSYPIVNGTVVVKIFRKQNNSANMQKNGSDVVDQFIAKDNVSIDANTNQKFDFSWNVPAYAKSGDYQVVTFFTSGKEFNLLGLTFTDDIVGNTFDFKVNGQQKNIVEFDKNSAKINGIPYMFAAFPPIIDATKTGVLTANLLNETDQNQTVNVTWKTYWWDAERSENLLDTKTDSVDLSKGQTKNLSYTITDNTHSVYLVVVEVDYKDTKSILGARFTRSGIDIPRINFPAVTSFPLAAGSQTTLFSCLHSTSNNDVQSGSLSLKLEDPNGNIIHQYDYTGSITSAMMGVKDDFTPTKNYDKFSLVAELSQNGKVVDSAKMDYDCKNIDPSKCFTGFTATKTDFSTLIIFAVLIILAIILFFIFEQRKHKTITALVILVLIILGLIYLFSSQKVFGQTPTYDGSGGGSIVYTMTTPLLYAQDVTNNTHNNVGSINVSIKYNAVPYNETTGSVLSSGDEIHYGDKIKFTFHSYDDNSNIYWFDSGGSFDSPYGYWIGPSTSANYANPNSAHCNESYFVNGIYESDPNDPVPDFQSNPSTRLYLMLNMTNPVQKFINDNSDILQCDQSNSVDAEGNEYVECTVSSNFTATTTINTKFSFSGSTGKFRDNFLKRKYFNSKSNSTECLGAEKPYESGYYPYLSTTKNSSKASPQVDYVLSVPTQEIPYTFTAVPTADDSDEQIDDTQTCSDGTVISVDDTCPTTTVCTPKLSCQGNTIVDANSCNDPSVCVAPKVCSLVIGVPECDNIDIYGRKYNPLIEHADGAKIGEVGIKSFVVSPNTVNAYDNTNNTGGVCNFVWSIDPYDASSTCSLINSSGAEISLINPTASSTGTSTKTGVTSETTYHITCGEKSASGSLIDTTIKTKYATCNINAGYIETNH